MDWQAGFSLFLMASVVLAMSFTRLSPHIVMMTALVLLMTAGILTPQEALAGFSNEGLITVAAMFVLAAGIHSSGAIDMLVDKLLGKPGGIRSAMLRIFLPLPLLSAFLNNTPVVATMIPALHAWCRKIDIAPSKLMIPLSYATILGGTVTLIGTSTNIVVNGQYQTMTGEEGFSLFAITPLGLPVMLIGLTFMLIFYPRWLPTRQDKTPFENLREFTLEVAVAHDGPLVGKTVEQAALRNLKRIYLVEIERESSIVTAVSSEEILQGGDRLVFAGDTEAISDLLRINGIVPSADNQPAALMQDRPERRLVEAVVSPHCDGLGQALRDIRFRDRYGAAVLAVARDGERVPGNLGQIKLQAGDTLLLEARPAFVSRQKYNKDFLVINDLDTERPQHHKAWIAWAILLAVVLAASFDLISILNAALIGSGLMLASRCVTVGQAEKSLDLTVLITIAASFALGAALQKTGVASMIADNLIVISDSRPWLLLIITYLSVMLLTEMITNNAAALLMLPIVLELVEKANLNAEPFVLAVMMAASASFATPIGYQTNLMVYGPGGYRFTDFLRVGLPMNLTVATVTLALLILFWPLTLI